MYHSDVEVWKDIPGYEGYYQASTLGRIRSIPRTGHWARYDSARSLPGKVLKVCKRPQGYRVCLWKDKACEYVLVARAVALTFLGEPNLALRGGGKMTVNHKDGNRLNNAIENIEWLSLAENIRHAFREGLMTNQRSVTLINSAGASSTFRSMSLAGQFIGRSSGYISDCIAAKKMARGVDGQVYEVAHGAH